MACRTSKAARAGSGTERACHACNDWRCVARAHALGAAVSSLRRISRTRHTPSAVLGFPAQRRKQRRSASRRAPTLAHEVSAPWVLRNPGCVCESERVMMTIGHHRRPRRRQLPMPAASRAAWTGRTCRMSCGGRNSTARGSSNDQRSCVLIVRQEV